MPKKTLPKKTLSKKILGNKLADEKKSRNPAKAELEAVISEYIKALKKNFPKPKKHSTKEDQVMFFLHAMIIKMIDPNPEMRSSLAEVQDIFVDLVKLLQGKI